MLSGNASGETGSVSKYFLPYDLTIVFLDIYPNELKTCTYKNLPMNVVAVLS